MYVKAIVLIRGQHKSREENIYFLKQVFLKVDFLCMPGEQFKFLQNVYFYKKIVKWPRQLLKCILAERGGGKCHKLLK